MKKHLFIFGVIVSCSLSVFTQNKMDKATFEKLVDYANCQYLMAFIEKNDAGKDYIKNTYEKTVKPELQKAVLNDLSNVPTFGKIKNLFPKGSNESALQLANRINDRKSKYNESPDNNTLLELLKTKGWNNVDLEATAQNIQNRIRTEFNFEQEQILEPESSKTASTQVDELQAQIAELQQQYNNLKNDSKILDIQRSIKNLRLLIIILIFIIVGYLFLIIVGHLFSKNNFNSKTDKSRWKFIKKICGRISNKTDANSNVRAFEVEFQNLKNNFNAELQSSKNEFELKLKNLRNEFDKFPKKTNEFQQKSDMDELGGTNSAYENVKYLKGKNGNEFSRVEDSPDGAYWRMLKSNGETAQIEFYGTTEDARSKFNGIFDNVSETIGDIQNAKIVKTIGRGIIKLVDNKWKVTTPAKIKFE